MPQVSGRRESRVRTKDFKLPSFDADTMTRRAASWLLYGLGLCVFVPWFPLPFTQHYEHWMHVAFAERRQFGSEIHATYGPLGFIGLPFYHPPTYGLLIATYTRLARHAVRFDETVHLPAGVRAPLWALIAVEPTTAGRVFATLYKPAPTMITVTTPARTETFRCPRQRRAQDSSCRPCSTT